MLESGTYLFSLVTFVVTVFLQGAVLYIAYKVKLFRRSLILIFLGIMVSLLFHAAFEILGGLGVLDITFWMSLMPFMVALGAVITAIGAMVGYNDVVKPLLKLTDIITDVQQENFEVFVDPELTQMDNELGHFAVVLNFLLCSLKLAVSRSRKKSKKIKR